MLWIGNMNMSALSEYCFFFMCPVKWPSHSSSPPPVFRHAHQHQRDPKGEKPEAVSPQPTLPGPESDSSNQPQPLPVCASEPGAQTRGWGSESEHQHFLQHPPSADGSVSWEQNINSLIIDVCEFERLCCGYLQSKITVNEKEMFEITYHSKYCVRGSIASILFAYSLKTQILQYSRFYFCPWQVKLFCVGTFVWHR